MNSPASASLASSGKRSRNKLASGSEDEGNVMKKMKPDCCTLSDLNRSRIYNFGYRKKPAELFRKDLISAMKMPDSEQLNRDEYLLITDSWREEWEKGVQVPVYPDNLPMARVKVLREPKAEGTFKLPKKLIKSDSESDQNQNNYELDLLDISWLESINESDCTPPVTESQLENVINELEHQCARNMKAKQVGIEYDDHIICDVCRSPDAEEGNEMVFCDLCNICVHQACYGITQIPEGEWLCRPCREFGTQKSVSCVLCPNLGGALKPTSTSNQWAHVSCALWVPEASIGCVSTMEPITKIKQIPQMRWNLVCSLCNVKQGAPIQCSVKTCKIAYHVICAFNHKLKMKAIVANDGGSGVKLKSYCKKHSEKNCEEEVKNEPKQEAGSQSPQNQEIEIATFAPEETENDTSNEFWKYIDISKIQSEIQKRSKSNQSPLKSSIVQYTDLILQYWKLKRTSNYGASLIKLTSAQFEEQQLQQRMDILRLRVDLERIRNLSYMICRREKIKRNWLKTHQTSIENAFNIFAGNPNFESHKYVTEEQTKLVGDIINCSVIYNYNKEVDKTRTAHIAKSLKRLAKIERLQKHKPNPYAKFYLTGIKRKSPAPKGQNESPPLNGLKTVNGLIAKTKGEKPINGLSSHQLSFNSPLNGLHSNSPKVSLSENKKSSLSYRQSPRSLLKPKATFQNVMQRNNEDKSEPSPVITRSSLVGYKIPKKKQGDVQKDKEIDESIQNFKRRLDAEFYPNRSPSPNKIPSLTNSPTYRPERITNYYHTQRDRYVTRAKPDRFYGNRNGRPQSILSQVTTRAQQGQFGQFDDAALFASDVNDIDMRRHQNLNYRQSLIH